MPILSAPVSLTEQRSTIFGVHVTTTGQELLTKACPHQATISGNNVLPFSTPGNKVAENGNNKRQQIVAVSGQQIPATICYRFRQLYCLVWTGL